MKMKFSIIAAVLAAGFASQANSSITMTSGLNDQLFLSVWDPVAQASYTRGLGLSVQTMITGAGVNFGASNTGSGFTATGDHTNYTLAADANLTSFLTTYAADAASMQWNVVAGEANTYASNAMVTTSNNMSTGWSSAAFTGIVGFNGAYLATVNRNMPAGSVAGNLDSVIATAATGGSAYAAAAGNGFGNNFGGGMPNGIISTAGLGQSLSFYLLSPTYTANARPSLTGLPVIYQFANASGNSSWVLSSNGALTYTSASVAAVPEPSEIGLMISGFGLVGFLANKRRKALKG